MSTGSNDPNQCRWCGMFHGPMCWALKAIEFHADGVTVRRVEFKTGTDFPQQMSDAPSMFRLSNTAGRHYTQLPYRMF